MRRMLLIAVALLLAGDLWAGDPWKAKSYKDWDESDVRKILKDSPWAKRIDVEGDQKRHAGLEAPEDAPAGESDGNEEAGRSGEKDKENEKGGTTLVIRWVSSRTMREAWARGQVLQKRILQVDTEKFLPPASDDYELLLVGPDMTLFEMC